MSFWSFFATISLVFFSFGACRKRRECVGARVLNLVFILMDCSVVCPECKKNIKIATSMFSPTMWFKNPKMISAARLSLLLNNANSALIFPQIALTSSTVNDNVKMLYLRKRLMKMHKIVFKMTFQFFKNIVVLIFQKIKAK